MGRCGLPWPHLFRSFWVFSMICCRSRHGKLSFEAFPISSQEKQGLVLVLFLLLFVIGVPVLMLCCMCGPQVGECGQGGRSGMGEGWGSTGHQLAGAGMLSMAHVFMAL